MTMGLLFWVLMLLWLFFGLWSHWPINAANGRMAVGNLLLFILITLLGWKVFGPAVHS